MSGGGGPLGFVGLGAMGAPMARRLLAAGHRVLAHDADPTALAAAAKAVALGPGGLSEGRAIRTYVDLSTTGARVAREVAEGLAPRGVVALDAPVSGGVAGAEAGMLSVMAAGGPAAFERVRPVLEAIGSNTVFVGGRSGRDRR